MSPDWRTAFTVGFGVCMLAGGKLAQRMLGLLGQRGHTSLSNVLTMAGMSVWGASPSIANMFLGLFVLVGAMERRAATSALLTKQAVAHGFSRGEFAGLFANFRFVVELAGRLLLRACTALSAGVHCVSRPTAMC
jgi:hypothetical protein